MTLLYVLLVVLVGLSLALLAASAPRALPVRLASRTAFGFALTPFLLGISTQLTLLIPNVPRSIVMSAPLIVLVPVAVTLWRTPYLPKALVHRSVRTATTLRQRPEVAVAIVMAMIAASVMLYAMYMNGSRPIIAHDAQIYLTEAKALAGLAAPSAFPEAGTLDTLPPTHPHTKLFSIFLAHALLFMPAEADKLGFTPVRFAFQMTLFAFVISLAGLAGLARRHGMMALAFLGFAIFPLFEYISSSQSRDAFRLIPIAIIVGLMAAFLVRKNWNNISAIFFGLIIFFAISGHTINIYFLFIACLVFFAYAIIRKTPIRQLFRLGIISVFISTPAVWHYLSNFIFKGDILGGGMNYTYLKGTPLMQVMLSRPGWSEAEISFFAAVLRVAQPQTYIASTLAFLSAITIIIVAFREHSLMRKWLFLLCGALALLFIIVPLSKLFPYSILDIKQAFLANGRYPYVVFMFGGPIIAFAIIALVSLLPDLIGRLAFAATSLALGVYAVSTVLGWPYYIDTRPIAQVVEADRTICALADRLAPDEIWLTDRYSIAYRCRRKPVFLYSTQGRPYFAAATVADAGKYLRDTNVGLVSLSNTQPSWWPVTTFGKALQMEESEERGWQSKRAGYWKYYRQK